uniref:BED-type domain-containing protein n=2 Tax=Meloidogyne TaxID=189290 RepID=A0A6V7TJP0_MELEN|nr:unnamed protein product [Meloidogyne enterolobii]
MDNQEEIDNENIESDLSEGEGIHVTEKQAKISINLNEPEDSLWRFFERPTSSSQIKIKCLLCKKSLSRGTDQSTSALHKHLKSSHPGNYKVYKKAADETKNKKRTVEKNFPIKLGQTSQSSLFQPVVQSKLPNDNKKSLEMDEKILKYMCWNCEPLSLTERPGFKEMINYSFPNYQVKGRDFMTDLLNKKYTDCFNKLKNRLENKEISITIDTWSNKNGDKSFLSITVHWISDEYTREFALGSATPLDIFESHTGEYLKTSLKGLHICYNNK